MAIWCNKFNTPNPFEGSHRVYRFGDAESSEARSESPNKQSEELVKQIDASKDLLAETKKILKDMLAKANKNELESLLSHISEAMIDIENGDKLFADHTIDLDREGARGVLREERDKILAKVNMTTADLARLKEINKETRALLNIGETIDRKNLAPESVQRLNQTLADISPSDAEVVLVNLPIALEQVAAIERLKDLLPPEAIATAWTQFETAYEDFVVSPTEIKELSRARYEAEQKVDLMEAHSTPDLTRLRSFALLFVRDSEGKALQSVENSIPDNSTFTVDFKDPVTGLINKFAQAKLTLGDILESTGRSFVTVTKANGTKTPAYLHSNGRTYSRPGGKGNYVEILQGYKITTPDVAPPQAIAEAATPVAPETPAAQTAARVATNPNFVAADQWYEEHDPTEYARIVAEREQHEKEGNLTYKDGADILLAESTDSDLDLGEEATVAPAEAVGLSSLVGQAVDVPKHFRGENSYEAIAKLKYLENGQAIYDAVRMMAAIHRDPRVGGPIDNRNMWENLRGGILSKGGRFTMSFNEMAKAVYGVNENKLDESLPHFEHFKVAAKNLLTYLDDAEETGTDASTYRKLREKTEYTGEKADMARITGQAFERNSYGPPVSGNIFQQICWSLPGKQRPVITQDSWADHASQSRKAKGYKTYGEQEVISHARMFDKMVGSPDMASYHRLLNNFLKLGRDGINAEHTAFGFAHELVAPEVSIEDLQNPNFELSEDQIIAIRHGAMRFAAIEMGVYQRVEAERETADTRAAATELADQLTSKVAAEQNLTAAQTEELQKELDQKIYLMLTGMVAFQPGEDANGNPMVHTMGTIAAGVGVPILPDKIPGNLSLEWVISGNTMLPVIQTSVGLVYRIDIGKLDRGHFEAFARVNWGLSDPSGYIGPNAGIGYSHDLNTDGTVALGGGVGIGLREDGNLLTGNLGLDFDQGAILKKKIREFKESPEVKEKLVATKREAYTSIDALNVDSVQKEALKRHYDSYINDRISRAITERFVGKEEGQSPVDFIFSQIKVVSVGVTAGVGLKEGGFAVGPYITIGIGFRATTLYVPPLETPDQIAWSMENQLPSNIEGYKAPEANWQAVSVTDEILWNGDSSSYTDVLAKAEMEASKAREAMAQGVSNDAILTPGARFTNIDFKDLNGSVRLYVDSRSGIETIQDGPQDIGLNLDSADSLLIRIIDMPASHGGENIVIVAITNDANASVTDIIQNSGNMLTWTQHGSFKGNTSLADNSAATGAGKLIYTQAEASERMANRTLTLGDLSPEGAKQNVRQVRLDEVQARVGVREVKLFDGLDKEKAQTVADIMLAEGMNYDLLATTDRNDEINAKVSEIYKWQGVEEPTIQEIYYARQFAMERSRPDRDRMPLEWNKKRLQEISKDFSGLLTTYLEKNKDQLENGRFEEGTMFFISINENGPQLLQGYYDAEVHGSIVAPVEWDSQNPKQTLAAMGFDEAGQNDPENIRAVQGMAKAILNMKWPETRLDENAVTFDQAMVTMGGALLASHAREIYGPVDGAKINAMVRSGNGVQHPALAAQFARDVARLLNNADMNNGSASALTMINDVPVTLEWNVSTGLYEKCFNLVCGLTPELKWTTPTSKEVRSASTRTTIETGMTPEERVTFQTLRIAPGVIPVVPTGEVVTPPTSEGDGVQVTGPIVVGTPVVPLAGHDDASDF